MNKEINKNELISAFDLGELKSVNRIDMGHINETFVFETEKGKFLVQQLNTTVFKKPVELMENVVEVTRFLAEKVKKKGGDVSRECLKVFPAKDGKNYYIDSENRFWRCFNFVDKTYSPMSADTPELFEKSARAFGEFQRMLADYPSETLVETIPNFHNTASRFLDFKRAVEENLSGRKDTCLKEIDFILQREKDCSVLVNLIGEGKLPLRVTHNDTKLNNVLFDNESNEGICVIDLDTVMPGLSLYDFGDSIRFGASTATEDEKDLDKVHFSLEYFKAYTRGFLSKAGKVLTKCEIDHLPFASKLMTLECGMRFLGDYLNGDVYFRTEYPEHNLDRARTQLKLVMEMEEQMEKMSEAVEEIYFAIINEEK